MQPDPLSVTALTAATALGQGGQAIYAALVEGRSGLRPNDFDGGGWIGRVPEADQHRLPARLAEFDCRNNRLADMALQAGGFPAAVAAAAARHGAGRVAVVLGTSTSGVLSAEDAFLARTPDGALPGWFRYAETHDMFSVARYVRAALGLRGPAMVVSTACASAAKTFIEARHLIRAGLCDAAVVGGADSLCRLTLRGFAALELISPEPCRPCDAARAGISIGEAAGFALLERGEGPMRLLGAGASSDGFHMSTPHPQGAGAIAAMADALRDAGHAAQDVDHISLHGTGTQANDAMEDTAVAAVFGPGMRCSSSKGAFGHTLGASGIVGAMVAQIAIERGFVPGCTGMVTPDPAFRGQIATAGAWRAVRTVMTNSFGFGGVNCSLLFGAA